MSSLVLFFCEFIKHHVLDLDGLIPPSPPPPPPRVITSSCGQVKKAAGGKEFDQLKNFLPFETEVNGLILTLSKVEGLLEAVSLPSGSGKAIYISPLSLPRE
nr:hypothetical protein [Tanacetum cinerariifolium]